MMTLHAFADRHDAAAAAGEQLYTALHRKLAISDSASLVVSGGTTPAPIYAALAERPLDWDRVTILLSDERWVSPDDSASNEAMLRKTLLVSHAESATLLPMYDETLTPEERCDRLSTEISRLSLPFASCLLGMGADGHFASLFPDSSNLAEGLHGHSTAIAVHTAASEHLRLSLTLATLLNSSEIVLVIFGDDKRRVFDSDDPALPITQLKLQTRAPLTVYWAT